MSKSNPNERDLSQNLNPILLELLRAVGAIQEDILEMKQQFQSFQKALDTLTLKQTTQNLLPSNESNEPESDVIINNNNLISDTQIGAKRHRGRQDDEKGSQAMKKTKVCNFDNDSPLCQLPLDAIDTILFYLDYISLVSISETCKFFYYYASDDKYWKYFNDHHYFKQFRIPISYIDFGDDDNTEIITNNNNSDNIIIIPKISLEKKGGLEKKYFTTRFKTANNWDNGNFFCGAIETSAKYVFMQINDMNPNQVTTSNLNELTEWDINTGEIISCFQIPNKCHYFNMRYNRIAVSGDDAVRVYDKESKSFLYEVEGLLSQAHRTEIIENYLVLGFWDGDINIHNLQNGAFINKISGHNKPVHALSCHLGDGFNSRSMVASGSSDKSVKLFDMFKTTKEDQFVAHLRGHSMTINAIQFTSGGRQLLSASKDTTIKLWDLETCVCLDILSKHTDSVNALRAENGWVVSGSADKTVRIWDLRTPSKLIHTLTGHESPVSCLDVDEGKIVSLDDTRILLWRFDYF